MVKALFVFYLLSSTAIGMQTPKELALQLENHPVSITSFLWRYAIAEFCDVDEKGVYYNGIQQADHDTTFTLPWEQVKKILGQAYEDLARFDVSKEDVPLKNEYKRVLRCVQKNDVQECQDTLLAHIYENRRKYKDACISGNAAAVKEALKLDLFVPHID